MVLNFVNHLLSWEGSLCADLRYGWVLGNNGGAGGTKNARSQGELLFGGGCHETKEPTSNDGGSTALHGL